LYRGKPGGRTGRFCRPSKKRGFESKISGFPPERRLRREVRRPGTGPAFASRSPGGTVSNVARLTIAESAAKLDPPERSLQLALAAARTAEDNRGENIVVLDMRSITPVFDYFVIITGNSRRQLHAISEEIERVLQQELRDKRMGIEGYEESRWILLDYGNVVVHLFDQETREFYALEDFWSQAERVPLPWQAGDAVDQASSD
jgi:ribosome-associated protein